MSQSPEHMDLELKKLFEIRGIIKLPENFDFEKLRYEVIIDKHVDSESKQSISEKCCNHSST